MNVSLDACADSAGNSLISAYLVEIDQTTFTDGGNAFFKQNWFYSTLPSVVILSGGLFYNENDIDDYKVTLTIKMQGD